MTRTAAAHVSRAQFIFDALVRAGARPFQAAGVLGNSAVETGGTFSGTAYNPGENAIGIAQWEGGRRTALQAFAARRGKPETDLATQVAFLIRESKARGNWRELLGARTVTDAAHVWQRDFEVSAPDSLGQRESDARSIYGAVRAGRPLGGGGALNPAGARHLGGGGLGAGGGLGLTGASSSSSSSSSSTDSGISWSDLLPWNWGNAVGKVAGGVLEVVTTFLLKVAFVLAGLALVVLGLYLAGKGRNGGGGLIPIPV